jgi:hypothetical protein
MHNAINIKHNKQYSRNIMQCNAISSECTHRQRRLQAYTQSTPAPVATSGTAGTGHRTPPVKAHTRRGIGNVCMYPYATRPREVGRDACLQPLLAQEAGTESHSYESTEIKYDKDLFPIGYNILLDASTGTVQYCNNNATTLSSSDDTVIPVGINSLARPERERKQSQWQKRHITPAHQHKQKARTRPHPHSHPTHAHPDPPIFNKNLSCFSAWCLLCSPPLELSLGAYCLGMSLPPMRW